MTKAQIEPAIIHADDGIRLVFNRQREQLVEQPAIFEKVFQHVGNADDRVLGQVKRQVDAGGGSSSVRPRR